MLASACNTLISITHLMSGHLEVQSNLLVGWLGILVAHCGLPTSIIDFGQVGKCNMSLQTIAIENPVPPPPGAVQLYQGWLMVVTIMST